MKPLRKHWLLGILILFSVTPIIWYVGKGDILINGVDTNFPLDPLVWFKRRFFVWDAVPNGGRNFASSIAGIFFHLVQVIPFVLGFSLRSTQLISLLFWFSLVIFSAFFFAKTHFSKSKYSQLIFVLLYCFNIYLFNTWENVKVSNLSLVAALPLSLSLLKLSFDQKLDKPKLFLCSILVGLVVSGSGINPAYFLTYFIANFLYTLVRGGVNFKKENFRNVWISFAITSLGAFVINLFWILPTLHFLLFSTDSVSNLSDIGLANWLDSLSENSSFVNLLRLQGAWDWYAFETLTHAPVYLDYTVNYFYKISFIIFSFVTPAMIFMAFVFRKRSENSFLYTLSGIYVLLGLFLSAGSHDPTGDIYLFLASHVPFFSFFRSPWYIFSIFTILGGATLVSLLVGNIESTVFANPKNQKKLLFNLAISVFVVGHLLYSYPLVTGKIFRPARRDGFYVSFPDHVWRVRDKLSSEKNFPRYIVYPDDTIENYSWGYRGVESLTSLFSDSQYIAPSVSISNEFLKEFMDHFYFLAKRGYYDLAFSMIDFVGADTVLYKKDVATLAPAIDTSTFQSEITTYGEWEIIKTALSSPIEKIFIPKNSFLNYSDNKTLATSLPIIANDSISILATDTELIKFKNEIDTTSIIKANETIKQENLLSYSLDQDNLFSYSINIPEDSKYEIVIFHSGDYPQIISIDGKDTFLQKNEGAYAIYGPVNIDQGEHSISYGIRPASNQIKISDFSSYNKSLGLRRDAVLGITDSTLIARSDSLQREFINIPITEFNPFNAYKLSFDYKYEYGSIPSIGIVQGNEKTLLKVEGLDLDPAHDWQYYEFDIDPIDTHSFLEIAVEMPANREGDSSKSYFESFSLRKVNKNEVFAIESKNTILENESVVASWNQINPTEYEVDVSKGEGGYVLAFLESYSPDWVIISDDISGKQVHFTANGFANGWYISGGKETQKITIYYKPQKYFEIGLTISAITLLLSIGLVYFKKKHE